MKPASWSLLALLAVGATTASCTRAPAVDEAPVLEPSGPAARKRMVRRIVPTNVRLVVYEGAEERRSASGVVIAQEVSAGGSASFVITNAHAVDPAGLAAPRVGVRVDRHGDVLEYAGEAVALGRVPDMDLALVRVGGVQLPAAELAEDAEPELGEDVVVAAAPYGRALSLSGGMVSQVEWDRATRRPSMLKTDAPVGYGASGGGVFSAETGRLLAVVEGYRTAKVGFAVAEQSYSFDVPMPGETFAAPSAKVRAFLAAHGYGRLLARPGAQPPPAQPAAGVEARR